MVPGPRRQEPDADTLAGDGPSACGRGSAPRRARHGGGATGPGTRGSGAGGCARRRRRDREVDGRMRTRRPATWRTATRHVSRGFRGQITATRPRRNRPLTSTGPSRGPADDPGRPGLDVGRRRRLLRRARLRRVRRVRGVAGIARIPRVTGICRVARVPRIAGVGGIAGSRDSRGIPPADTRPATTGSPRPRPVPRPARAPGRDTRRPGRRRCDADFPSGSAVRPTFTQ